MWDLTASACSCELVPEIGTAVRSLTVALDGTMIVAANNHGTCYVWRMMRGAYVCVCGVTLAYYNASRSASYMRGGCAWGAARVPGGGRDDWSFDGSCCAWRLMWGGCAWGVARAGGGRDVSHWMEAATRGA